MYRLLINILSVIITSFYFFPIEFIFLPGVNTKMAMAGIGLVILGKRLAQRGGALINKDFMILSVLALLISMASFVTMTINNTPDDSFLTYFVSMWVWMGGAYFVIRWLKNAYGYVNIILVCNCLIAVCVIQCFIALLKDIYSPLQSFVDSFIGGEAYMGDTGNSRLSGIGAALDVAGLRFASVAIIIGCILAKTKDLSNKQTILYLIAFLVIAIIGNMISRTTTIGICIALFYWLYLSGVFRMNNNKLWSWLGVLISILLPVFIYLYNTDVNFYKNIRFGFEGFFSLWETGHWQTGSNDILLNHMMVLPDNLHTWLIGDGYASNPLDKGNPDPYYTGPVYHGYYKGTDIGYLRYIFYFGVVGTVLFIIFMWKAASICVYKFKEYKIMFLLILLMNYIGWIKVSTDIFLVFALFLALDSEQQQKSNQQTLIL